MQGVMAVYSAVNITPIQRLHETWKNLPNKYAVVLKSVGMFFLPLSPFSPRSLPLALPLSLMFMFAIIKY
jgi:hypothetical protein